ncbi:phosphodiester glycosidase family protein [Streptomyces zaomyceticus]|uniref:phosphodiester glycosidase family protein n=1 Tax=Streptomyces zaomyceticus TaxID=68286 RepID=UPI002E224E1B
MTNDIAAGRTTRRAPRRLIALAAAVSAAFLLAAPHQSGAAEPTADPMDNWTYDADSQRLAAGANYFRYLEKEGKLVGRTTPRELSIVRIDPSAGPIRVENSFGKKAGVQETVREQLSSKPLAGINASFGTYDERSDGVESMAFYGLAARDGVINGVSCVFVSDADKDADGRYVTAREGMMATVLQYGFPHISRLKSKLTVQVSATANGPAIASHPLDDVNRTPGRAQGCARDLDDANNAHSVAYSASSTETVYQDPDELIVFNGNYGVPTPPKDLDKKIPGDDAAGLELVVGKDGLIGGAPKTVRGGQQVAAGGHALQAIGEESEKWLEDHAIAGRYLQVVQEVIDVGSPTNAPNKTGITEQPRTVTLDSSTDIVSNMHWLLHDGEPAPGLSTCKRLYDVNGNRVESDTSKRARQAGDFCRDSRTAIGVDEQGRTLFVTITGPRNPGTPTSKNEAEKMADGAFMWEVRDILRRWGAVDAMNLDGGGSTTMLVNDERKTGLTDITTKDGQLHWTERKVGDSVYVGRGGLPLP